MSARNPFSLEAQTAAVIDGKWAGRRRANREGRLGRGYAAALEELGRAESKLARALMRWQKARHAVRRHERELDKLAAAEGDGE